MHEARDHPASILEARDHPASILIASRSMPQDEAQELPLETALSQLEEIVSALERGEPDLAAALAQYETGVRLLSACYALLERAERSVALLSGVDSEGKAATAPFDATARIETERPKRKEPNGNEPAPVRKSRK